MTSSVCIRSPQFYEQFWQYSHNLIFQCIVTSHILWVPWVWNEHFFIKKGPMESRSNFFNVLLLYHIKTQKWWQQKAYQGEFIDTNISWFKILPHHWILSQEAVGFLWQTWWYLQICVLHHSQHVLHQTNTRTKNTDSEKIPTKQLNNNLTEIIIDWFSD